MKELKVFSVGRLRRALGDKEFQKVLGLYEATPCGKSIKPASPAEIKCVDDYLGNKIKLKDLMKGLGRKTLSETYHRMGQVQVFAAEHGLN